MTHLSEGGQRLALRHRAVQSRDDLLNQVRGFSDVCLVRLPGCNSPDAYRQPLEEIGALVAQVAASLAPDATLIMLGDVVDLVLVQAAMPTSVRYQHWISIKRTTPQASGHDALAHQHFGALIHTRYPRTLRHSKTRVAYTYCPVCEKTTKDYGGKKHTYHAYGTLLSDVWRDIPCDLEGDIEPVLTRFADLFGIPPYQELLVLDCRTLHLKRAPAMFTCPTSTDEQALPAAFTNQVLHGDCLERLADLPDNSIDFAFADPPYNLSKQYSGYADDLELTAYFNWCDQWIAEIARILKPGRTCTILNIPLWAVRHFLFMRTVLTFQNWITWDALAFPVRLIMPAHYTMLCFSKGQPRALPGLIGESGLTSVAGLERTFQALEPLAEGFCLRTACVTRRQAKQINDRAPLTDLWWDIHRLKHNSRRVDHPCQLPPHLMYRLIALFTRQGDVVLDCFNGAGTTTLAAHQLDRRYVGIEASESYCTLARERHDEIRAGLDPFRKVDRILTAKNSPVPRLPKQKYAVSKKTLQLEVKRVAQLLGRLPTRDEMAELGAYPLDYYTTYFSNWGEVCAAARTTGMSETRQEEVAEVCGENFLDAGCMP